MVDVAAVPRTGWSLPARPERHVAAARASRADRRASAKPHPAVPRRRATKRTAVRHQTTTRRTEQQHRSGPRRTTARTVRVPARGARARIVAIALDQLGRPYVHGAEGPRAYDCSGLVLYAYRRGAGRSLPHKAARQSAMGRVVRRPQVGDLAFWGGRGTADHIAIVVRVAGGVRIVDAPAPGRRVSKRAPWGGVRYVSLL